jgi:large subunit ribosomal protein L24
MKTIIKKGDTVKVISGSSKGQQGRVLNVDRKSMRATVEGVNLISKHTKPNAANPDGGIIKKEGSIHISNLMLVDGNGSATRVSFEMREGKKVRVSKKSKEVIK